MKDEDSKRLLHASVLTSWSRESLGYKGPSLLRRAFAVALVLDALLLLLGCAILRLNVRADYFASFGSSLLFLSLTLVGSSNWSTCQASATGAFISVFIFCALQYALGSLLILGILSESAVLISHFYKALVPRRIGSLPSQLQDFFAGRFESKIVMGTCKRFLPGLYYKILLPREEFRAAVARSRVSAKDATRKEIELKALESTDANSNSPELCGNSGGMGSIKSAVEDVGYRIHDVGSVFRNQSMDLVSRLQDINLAMSQVRKNTR